MKWRSKIFVIIITATICCSSSLFAQSQQKIWQESKSIAGNFKAVSSHPDIEVFSAPNVIMVKINKETEVRIFTILGKLISSQNLKPGIFEFHLDAHGIYIIKTDDNSTKIAI